MGNSESRPGEELPKGAVQIDAHSPGVVKASPRSSNKADGERVEEGAKEPYRNPARAQYRRKEGDHKGGAVRRVGKLKEKAAAAVGLGGATEAKKREERLRAERRERRRGIPNELYIPSANSWGESFVANNGSSRHGGGGGSEAEMSTYRQHDISEDDDIHEGNDNENLFSPISNPSDIMNRLKKEEKWNAEQRRRMEDLARRLQKLNHSPKKERDAVIEKQRKRLDELRNTPPPTGDKLPLSRSQDPRNAAVAGQSDDLIAVEKWKTRDERPRNRLHRKDYGKRKRKAKKKSAVSIHSMFRRKSSISGGRRFQSIGFDEDDGVKIKIVPASHNLRRMSMIDLRDVVDVGIPTTEQGRFDREKDQEQEPLLAKDSVLKWERNTDFLQDCDDEEGDREAVDSNRNNTKVGAAIDQENTIVESSTDVKRESDDAVTVSPTDSCNRQVSRASHFMSPFVDTDGRPFDLSKIRKEDIEKEQGESFSTSMGFPAPLQNSCHRKMIHSCNGHKKIALGKARCSTPHITSPDVPVQKVDEEPQTFPYDEKTPVPSTDPFLSALQESDRALKSIERMSGANHRERGGNESFLAALEASNRALQNIDRMSGNGPQDKTTSRLSDLDVIDDEECDDHDLGSDESGEDGKESLILSLFSSKSCDIEPNTRPESRESFLNETMKTPMVHLGPLFADMSVHKPSFEAVRIHEEANASTADIQSSPTSSELSLERGSAVSDKSSILGTTPAATKNIFRLGDQTYCDTSGICTDEQIAKKISFALKDDDNPKLDHEGKQISYSSQLPRSDMNYVELGDKQLHSTVESVEEADLPDSSDPVAIAKSSVNANTQNGDLDTAEAHDFSENNVLVDAIHAPEAKPIIANCHECPRIRFAGSFHSPETKNYAETHPYSDATVAEVSLAPSLASALKDVDYSITSDISIDLASRKRPDRRAVSTEAMDNASFLFGASHMGRCRTSTEAQGRRVRMDLTRIVGTGDLSRRISSDESKRGLYPSTGIPAIIESLSYPAPSLPRPPSRPIPKISTTESFDLSGSTKRLSLISERVLNVDNTMLLSTVTSKPMSSFEATEKEDTYASNATRAESSLFVEELHRSKESFNLTKAAGEDGSRSNVEILNETVDPSRISVFIVQSVGPDGLEAHIEDTVVLSENPSNEVMGPDMTEEENSKLNEGTSNEMNLNMISSCKDSKKVTEAGEKEEENTMAVGASSVSLCCLAGRDPDVTAMEHVSKLASEAPTSSACEPNLFTQSDEKGIDSESTKNSPVDSLRIGLAVAGEPRKLISSHHLKHVQFRNVERSDVQQGSIMIGKARTFDRPANMSLNEAVKAVRSFDLCPPHSVRVPTGIATKPAEQGTPHGYTVARNTQLGDAGSPLSVWTQRYPAITPMKTISPLERVAAARKKFGAIKNNAADLPSDDDEETGPSEPMGYVMSRVTEIDGRLRRSRQPSRRNRRRETGGAGVLAPRKATLTNPAFRPPNKHLDSQEVYGNNPSTLTASVSGDEALGKTDLAGRTEDMRHILVHSQSNQSENTSRDNFDSTGYESTKTSSSVDQASNNAVLSGDQRMMSNKSHCEDNDGVSRKNSFNNDKKAQSIDSPQYVGVANTMSRTRDSLWIDEILGHTKANEEANPDMCETKVAEASNRCDESVNSNAESVSTISERHLSNHEHSKLESTTIKDYSDHFAADDEGSRLVTETAIEESPDTENGQEQSAEVLLDSCLSPHRLIKQRETSERNSSAGDQSMLTNVSLLSTESEDIFANLAKQQAEMCNTETCSTCSVNAGVSIASRESDEDVFAKLVRLEDADENSVLSIASNDQLLGTETTNGGTDSSRFEEDDYGLMMAKPKKPTHKVRWSLNDENALVISPPSKGEGVYEAPTFDKENVENQGISPTELPRFSDSSKATVNPREQNMRALPTAAPPGSTSVLCLSPVQRTPLQARKWRTLAAAHAANKKEKPSAKKKKRNSAKKKKKVMRS